MTVLQSVLCHPLHFQARLPELTLILPPGPLSSWPRLLSSSLSSRPISKATSFRKPFQIPHPGGSISLCPQKPPLQHVASVKQNDFSART